MGGKLPDAVCVHISAGERHGFGATAPLCTRVSSLEHGKAGGPIWSSPKLIRKKWVRIEQCRRVTRTNHSFCCSGGLQALASLGV